MYYTGRLEVFNENFLVVSSPSLPLSSTLKHFHVYKDDFTNKIAKLLTQVFVSLNQADQKLTYALMHCNPQSESNLRYLYCMGLMKHVIYGIPVCCGSNLCSIFRRILKFLIPVKLSIGVLPKRTLLERYNLLEVCLLLLAGYCLSWRQL